MSATETPPDFADFYLRSSEIEDKDQYERYRQAVRIGYVEMERIVEDVIIPEFEKVGMILMDDDYDVEVVVFDTQSSVSEDLYVCGAGLRVSEDDKHSAIVYTGDPYRFAFTLQTHNYAGEIVELDIDYHKLTPYSFYKSVMDFLRSTFPEVDFGEFAPVDDDQWRVMEGPFTVKLEDEEVEGEFKTIAEAGTIEEAMKIASVFCTAFSLEDKLILEDSLGHRVY